MAFCIICTPRLIVYLYFSTAVTDTEFEYEGLRFGLPRCIIYSEIFVSLGDSAQNEGREMVRAYCATSEYEPSEVIAYDTLALGKRSK